MKLKLHKPKFGFTRTNFSKKSLGGFTIIEVMIVLAVGGLILSLIFLAVPQLQRNQRDQARKVIASRIKSEIENYASNNNGRYPFNNVDGACPAAGTNGTPGDWPDFYNDNLSKITIKDPSLGTPVISCTPSSTPSTTASYVASWAANIPLAGSKGLVSIVSAAACSGSSVVTSAAANAYAVVIGLDISGVRYCADNS